MNSSCECLLLMRFQAETKSWLYFMVGRLRAYLWGIAAGFDSVMCVKRLNRFIFQHSTSTCISALLSDCAFFSPHRDSFCLFMVLFFSFHKCVPSNIFCSWGLNSEIYRKGHYIRVQRTLERVSDRIQNSSGDLWTIPGVRSRVIHLRIITLKG